MVPGRPSGVGQYRAVLGRASGKSSGTNAPTNLIQRDAAAVAVAVATERCLESFTPRGLHRCACIDEELPPAPPRLTFFAVTFRMCFFACSNRFSMSVFLTSKLHASKAPGSAAQTSSTPCVIAYVLSNSRPNSVSPDSWPASPDEVPDRLLVDLPIDVTQSGRGDARVGQARADHCV